ncbi:hypothetical protein [uncultured Methanomethylovorans sp.]|uniref:hypothetical protein n=1 Tax=uncultured Methanomethylovorans sp. TaxID=183759 RepID=UPI002AA8DCED|nr:hypothetical protein [uncultured Methanomethylovorans sp.]
MQKKSNKLICFGLVLFTIMTIGISSADSLDVELIGQIGGSDSAVAIAGNYTYTGQGQDLVVYDTTNADNPVELERITTSGFVYHIAVEGNYAYIAGNNGLTIFDISIPSSPVIAGNYSGYTENIEVLDNYA